MTEARKGQKATGGRGKTPAGRPQGRLHEILEILGRTYPDACCELRFTTPLELLVATILSAQCTDVRVNQVTATLFKKYRSAADYAAADPATFEQEIRSTGFFRNKAKNILACARALVRDFGGVVPRTMDELVTLPGVGRKTANIVLYNAYGVPGFGVDTHVVRVTNRLGLVDTEDPEKIEAAICSLVPDASWGQATHRFIFHGRRTCHAKQPACPGCALGALCSWPGKA
jgi:endonuclease-3